MFWEFDRLAPNIYRTRAVKLGFRKAHDAVVEAQVNDAGIALKVLDAHLAGRDWLVGEGTTIADIDVYGVVAYAPAGGFALESYPNVMAWMARIETLPGYAGPDALLPRASRAA